MTITRLVLTLGFAAAVAPIALSAQEPADRPRREPAPAGPAAAAPASPGPGVEASRRVVVTAPFATAYSCAAVTCRVVSELDKGVILTIVKTDGEWLQAMVRTAANAMTTGWVRAAQVAPTADATTRMTGTERSDGIFRPAAADAAADPGPDARGCLTCLATREPTQEEWSAALADAARKKASPDAARVAPGLADGRTSDERMRDVFSQRYDPELKRLVGLAAEVDADLQSYLASCFQRFASIQVEGAAPRSTAVDDILRAARSSPGAARFALWSGTAAFQWNPTWAPQPQANDTSATPSCERLWEDARGRADRLKVDLEFLERDASEQNIYPGIVREMLAARGLAEPTGQAPPPAPPVTDIR